MAADAKSPNPNTNSEVGSSQNTPRYPKIKVTNIEFYPQLISFAFLVGIGYCSFIICEINTIAGHLFCFGVLVLTLFWQFKNRFTFGRWEPRGHWDDLNWFLLPKPSGDTILWDELTTVDAKALEESQEDNTDQERLQKELEAFNANPDSSSGSKVSFDIGPKDASPIASVSHEKAPRKKDFKSKRDAHYENEFQNAMLAAKEMMSKLRSKNTKQSSDLASVKSTTTPSDEGGAKSTGKLTSETDKKSEQETSSEASNGDPSKNPAKTSSTSSETESSSTG